MSARKITAALCILWQCFHLSSCSIAYMKYSKLAAINWGLPLAGHKLNVTPIATSTVTNHIKCITECAKTEGCVAINLGPSQAGEHECEMLKTTRHSLFNANVMLNSISNAIFIAKPGWTYVGPKTKCDAYPCPKKLLCISQEHESTGYTCVKPAKVGDRIISRGTNNKYFAGKIASISEKYIGILFDDGDTITHPLDDVTAVFTDTVPVSVKFKDHVIAAWQGSYAQYIGYVIEVSEPQGFKIRFADNDESWYHKKQLRILPDAATVHDVGARVFGRWTNGLYYRSFVSKSNLSSVSVTYDDGAKITLSKNDKAAVILDKIPEKDQVKIDQRVIAYRPNQVTYYPAYISQFCEAGNKYLAKFDDGSELCESIYEIRIIL